MADMNGGSFQITPETVGAFGTQAAGGAPSLGVSGGQNRVALAQMPDIHNIDEGSNLPAFLEGMFAPKIKAAQQRKFYEGFTRAAMGASQAEISADVPWYAKIFGPVPYELGAEAYAVQKAGADLDTYVTDNMTRLRTLPTEQVSAEIQEQAMQYVGDDPYTSALVSKSLMDRMGPILDLHTKERYAWQQTELVNAQVSNGMSQLQSFSKMRRAYSELGSKNPNDVEVGYQREQLQRNLLTALATPEDQNPDSVATYWSRLVREAADSGFFDGIAVLMQHGLGDSMSPEQRSGLEGYVRARWSEFKDKALVDDPDLYMRAVKIKTAAHLGLGGAQTTADMEKFNADWQSKYGYMPYFDGGEMADTATMSATAWASNEEQAMRAAASEAKEAQKEAAKEAAKSKTAAMMRSAIVTGQRARYENLDGVNRDDTDRMYTQVLAELEKTNPAMAAGIIVHDAASDARVSPEVSRQLQSEVARTTTGSYNDAFLGAYERWSRIHSGTAMAYNPVTGALDKQDTTAGPSTAAMYYGAETNKRMEQFQQLLATNMPAPLAYQMSWGDNPAERPVIEGATLNDVKEARNSLADVLDDLASTGATDLTKNNRRLLAQHVSAEYASLPTTGDAETRARWAIRSAKAAGLEVHGHYLWQNPAGSTQPRLASYLKSNDGAIEESVDRAFTKALGKVGVKVADDTDTYVVRLPDTGGVAQFAVTALDADGNYRWTQVSSDDIKAEEKMRAAEPGARRAALSGLGIVSPVKLGL